MAGARFCWRERTERVNWRMLRGLRLDDVVRRGDATLLEPYALHLTFARLPVVVAALSPSRHDDPVEGDTRGDARNAWFLMRVMQLAMEYLLFLRARDGAVVDSLRDELMACEKECELLGERAKKWKERSRSGEKQVDKLHQVLQGIAKLLQIEGATPNAVSTIESLLSDLVAPRHKRGGDGSAERRLAPQQIEEARVCALCGKMFSSQEYLEKHVVRRHPGLEATQITSIKNSLRQPKESPEAVREGNQKLVGTESSARELRQMLRAVEETLQEHQKALRTVAREEADRIQNIYEQLHVETQLVEEMRTKRVAIETEVAKNRGELEVILHKKEAVTEELRIVREQLEFLELKKRIEAQSGGGNTRSVAELDTSLQLELHRLEETITVLKDALATSREELTRLQDSHGSSLKEKQALETQVHESQNHVQRLEASLRQQEEKVPLMKRDVGLQSIVEVATAETQTDELPEPILPQAPLVLSPARMVADEVGVQTESIDVHANLSDSMIQTDPMVETTTTPKAETRSTRDVGVDTEAIQEIDLEGYSVSPDANAVFNRHCIAIADEIERRAVRYAHSRPSEQPKWDRSQNDKPFVSLPRRKFIRSRFLHDEKSVKREIATRVAKLEHAMQRYGVQPKSSVLANEHVEVVQRAIHAHLEVLPVEALQRMVDIETMVNNLIKTEWMPQEKSRQEALESLTATLEMKSQRNQGLVRQAMAGFTTVSTMHEDASSLQSPSPAEPARHAPVEVTQSTVPVSSPGQSETSSPDMFASGAIAKPDGGINDRLGEHKFTIHNIPAIEPSEKVDPEPTSPLPVIYEEPLHNVEVLPPSPKSVQAIRKQTAPLRSVKVVSVSPKSSPPKTRHPSPPRVELQTQESDADHSSETHEEFPQPVSVRFNPMSGIGEATAPSNLAEQRHSTSLPSSFSAKHPESQLGIIIPSRYEVPHTRDYAAERGDGDLSPSGLGGDTDGGSSSNYSRVTSSHDLRWSGSAGQSGGVSERSLSVAASSEVSLDASIPSLLSDGATSDRGTETSKEIPSPQQPVVESPQVEAEEVESMNSGRVGSQVTITTIPVDFSAPSSEQTQSIVLPSGEVDDAQPTTTIALNENDVVAFDDSDIEEVVLA